MLRQAVVWLAQELVEVEAATAAGAGYGDRLIDHRLERREDLWGEVALQAADHLPLGLALGGAPLQLLDPVDEVGLAMRPPISPGLSRVTGRSETAAVRDNGQRWGTGERQACGTCRIPRIAATPSWAGQRRPTLDQVTGTSKLSAEREEPMHNQHAGLSQTMAEQHITKRRVGMPNLAGA